MLFFKSKPKKETVDIRLKKFLRDSLYDITCDKVEDEHSLYIKVYYKTDMAPEFKKQICSTLIGEFEDLGWKFDSIVEYFENREICIGYTK